MNPNLMAFIYVIICLKKIKNGTYIINLDEYADVGTHWTALYALNNHATYFDSFGVEHIPREIRRFIGNKNMQTDKHTIWSYADIFALDLLIACLQARL